MVGQKMTEHPLHLVRSTENTPPKTAKHPLGELNADRVGKHLVLFRASMDKVEELVARARAKIPGMTDMSTVYAVMSHNPDCVWAIARRGRYNQGDAGEGFIAMLPLTAAGLAQLGAGTLDTRNPDLRFLAKPNERP